MSAPILTLQNLVELQKQPSNVQVFLVRNHKSFLIR